MKSFAWAAASFGGNRLFLFVSTLVLARLLSPRDFGIVAIALTLSMYLELALDLGVGSSLVYEQEEGIGPRVQTAFTLSVLMASGLTLVGFLTAPLAAALFDVEDEVGIFRAIFFYLLIRGLGEVQDAVLKRNLEFRKRTIAELLNGFTRAAVSIALAVAGYDAWAIVWGLLAGTSVATVLKWAQVRFRPSFTFDRSVSSSLLRFGMAVVGLKVLGTIGENFDYLVVGGRLGATQLGYYTMAYRLPELLIANVYWIFSTVAFPIYSRTRATDPNAFRPAMLKALRLTTLFGFTTGTGLAVAARDLIPVLFSGKWTPAIVPMVFISLGLGVSAVGYASGDIFPAIGRPGLLLKINAAVVAAMFAGFLFAASYGIEAVAAVHLAAGVLYALIRLALANRLLGSTMRQCLEAMRPAFCAVGGILLLALPVRLATDPGAVALVWVIAAGAVGALGGIALGAPSVLAEIRSLVRDATARERL